jgi:hypothetical protein
MAAIFILLNFAIANAEQFMLAWCLYVMSCSLCFSCYFDDRHRAAGLIPQVSLTLIITRTKWTLHYDTWFNFRFTIWIHASVGVRAGHEIYIRTVDKTSVSVTNLGRICMFISRYSTLLVRCSGKCMSRV